MNDKLKFFLIGLLFLPVFGGLSVWLNVISERAGDELDWSNWYLIFLPSLPVLIVSLVLARKGFEFIKRTQEPGFNLRSVKIDEKGIKSRWLIYGFISFGIIGSLGIFSLFFILT